MFHIRQDAPLLAARHLHIFNKLTVYIFLIKTI
jgi:hypothetical protein